MNEADPFQAEGLFKVADVRGTCGHLEFQTWWTMTTSNILVKARVAGATSEMIVQIYAIRVVYDAALATPQRSSIA